MANKLSRREIAEYVGVELIKGTSTKKLANELAAYLIESKRVKELPLVVADVDYYLSQHGVVAATITSAFALDDATQKAVETFVTNATNATTVTLAEQIDPSVLGGLKLSLPGRELDNTIARKLTTLRTNQKA